MRILIFITQEMMFVLDNIDLVCIMEVTVVYRRTAPPSGALKGRKLMGGGYTVSCPISIEIPPPGLALLSHVCVQISES